MFEPPCRPEGPSVWLGKHLQNATGWVYRLRQETIAEIEANIARLAGRDAYSGAMNCSDFPLQTMAADLAGMRDDLAEGKGFIVLRGLDRDKYSVNDLGLVFRGFGAQFGIELTQSFYGDRLGDIRDISDEIPNRNMRRGYHSGGFQTAHTDPSGELDIVAMLSVRKAANGGESLIASAHAVHNMMLEMCPDLLAQMYEGFVLRRPDSDAEAMRRPPLIGNVPSFCYENGWLNCDFQNGYMRRAVENGNATLSPRQKAAIDVFVSLSNHPDVMLKMMLEPGDFQFINNRKILHGRAAYEDAPEKAMRRHLFRLWLRVPAWPRMPAAQATLLAADMAEWDAYAARKRA